MDNKFALFIAESVKKVAEKTMIAGVMNVPDTLNNDYAMYLIFKSLSNQIEEMGKIESGKVRLDEDDVENLAFDYRNTLYLLNQILLDLYKDKDKQDKDSYSKPLGHIMYWLLPYEEELEDRDDGYVYYVGDSNSPQPISCLFPDGTFKDCCIYDPENDFIDAVENTVKLISEEDRNKA